MGSFKASYDEIWQHHSQYRSYYYYIPFQCITFGSCRERQGIAHKAMCNILFCNGYGKNVYDALCIFTDWSVNKGWIKVACISDTRLICDQSCQPTTISAVIGVERRSTWCVGRRPLSSFQRRMVLVNPNGTNHLRGFRSLARISTCLLERAYKPFPGYLNRTV